MKTITRVDGVLFKFLAAILPLGLAGCVGGSADSSTDSAGVTVQGDVPVAYVKRANTVTMNPTGGAPFAAGGDLLIREKSSPSAPEHNITAAITQGKGDVSDPEVSYDGKKIVFSLRCPTSNISTVGGQAACTGHWNIWEYDMSSGGITGGSFRRITSSTTDDDVDPAYLPAGRGFVFTSNRQTKSHSHQPVGPGNDYYALDEYERERVFNLHTMDKDGGHIEQISFNVSHDRNPVVRPNGDIMFSRWEHLGDRNQFTVFRAKPDGTDLFVLYGAHSEGNSFLHPRDMDPAGKYAGFVATDLMPLQRTQEGGALVFIDAANYSEQNTPASATVAAIGGQKQMTLQGLNINRGLSQFGRITTPYPLWDGTNRVLFSYAPCQLTFNGTVMSCAQAESKSPGVVARLSDQNRLLADASADTAQDNVRPSYAIYMFDSAKQTMAIVAAPPTGYMYTDPIALQSRVEPNAVDPTNVDQELADLNKAKIEIRSVYDTDVLGRMGDPVLTAADLAPDCTTAIAKTTPIDPMDTRAQVADLVRMKDPADPAYLCAPARFVRATRAIPPPSNSRGLRAAIGNTNFEQQQIVGYAPIEPDGSFTLVIPADTPVALTVIDSKGRSFQAHTNWIQARPGERRTCDGCHGPRRGAALNSGTIVNAMPTALVAALRDAHQSGETMASTRARLDTTVLSLQADLDYTDVWADTARARPSISIKYTGNTNPANDLTTAVPVNGIINYPDHIQPLWTRNRGANTCVVCHADPAVLDLRANGAGTGRLVSYEELTVGDPLLDANGQPVTSIRNGVPVIERGAALIDVSASEGNAVGLARKSRLIEIMFGEDLMTDAAARSAHPNPPLSAPNHAALLNPAEKRLIAEWIDLGGQYYNDPFNGASGVRTISGLSEATFETQVLPVLRSTCAAGCHQGIGSNEVAAGTSFTDNRFVLTGDVTGDYNAALAMINDTCVMANNYLLSLPSTVPHPSNAVGQTTAILPLGSAGYTAIANWIQSGCAAP